MEIYCASADWMPRNLERRVEIMFPIKDDELKVKVYDILKLLLADTVKARVLNPEGTYDRIDKRGKELICAQSLFAQKANEAVSGSSSSDIGDNARVFVPRESGM